MVENGARQIIIDVISKTGEPLDGAFVSVVCGDFADHKKTKGESVTFEGEFDSSVLITVSHPSCIPQEKIIDISSQRLRQAIRMTTQNNHPYSESVATNVTQ
jgi:hypothetical protein